MKFCLLLCISLTLAHRAFALNIVFPNNESTLNSTEPIQMLTSPSTQPKCPKNMKLHPWKPAQNIWKCFCIPPFLFFPFNDTCCEPFRQGPCAPGNFVVKLIINDDEIGSRCTRNSCLDDGLVPYNGMCHNIITQPLCHRSYPYFNESSSEVECFHLQYYSADIIDAPPHRLCPTDSRPDKNGKCRPKL